MSVKTNVLPSCSLQTQTTTRVVPAQPKPRGLLTHNHSFNPTTQCTQCCCDGTVTTWPWEGEAAECWDGTSMLSPTSIPLQAQTLSCWPTPRPQGCLLGTEDAHGQAGLSCVSSQGRDVPRLTHMAPECAQPPGSRYCSGDHFTQHSHLTDQRH